MRRVTKKPSVRRWRAGAAMVEMALVLPMLVLLIFGLMEYGWMFAKLAQINNASRHGARIAVRPDATEENVEAAVDELMNQAGLGSSGYEVTVRDLSAPKGEAVTVVVSVSYSNVTLTHFGLLPVPESLTGRAAMAKEGP